MGNRVTKGKRLSYRDQSGASRAAHAAHWAGFEFEAGPVIVACVGDFGTVQVWAASEAEGKRVIRHAASIANLPVDDPEEAEWIVTSSNNPRDGKAGRFRVAEVWGLPVVTKRAGPNGYPEIE